MSRQNQGACTDGGGQCAIEQFAGALPFCGLSMRSDSVILDVDLRVSDGLVLGHAQVGLRPLRSKDGLAHVEVNGLLFTLRTTRY